MPLRIKADAANEIKLMLAAHRDALWARWNGCTHPQAIDPSVWQLVCNEGYYGEAFGVIRGLAITGYGYIGSDTSHAVQEGNSDIPEHNLKWWFNQVVHEYLEEEGFFNKTCNAGVCTELLEKYRKIRKPNDKPRKKRHG